MLLQIQQVSQMAHKRKSFLKKKAGPTDVSLQITSMADIFMILLVFLLKNYSASMTTIAPTAQLSLPEVSLASKASPRESLKVEISPDAVLVDQKPAVRLVNFEFPADEVQSSASSRTIARLMQEQRQLRPEPNRESSIVVMADQRAPYSTIKRVIASAAGAGFIDLQLVVVDPQ
jgi:biopolymer transport protein ExbD